MKKSFALWAFFAITPIWANQTSFIAQEKDNLLMQEGDIHKRFSPCSTFKIALILMGFDSDILINDQQPEWTFHGDPQTIPQRCQGPQTPQNWILKSCVWYSQNLTQKLGVKKFAHYVQNFSYGNQDITGDKGKNNGLVNCWLVSSLQISCQEQVHFLQKILDEQLPVKPIANQMAKDLLFTENLSNGWKLYGKTGSGPGQADDLSLVKEVQQGWFVGWVSKDKRSIVFAFHLIDDSGSKESAGKIAKEAAKQKLLQLIADIEKTT